MYLSQYDRDGPGKRTHRYEEDRLLSKSTGRLLMFIIIAWWYGVPLFDLAIWEYNNLQLFVITVGVAWGLKPAARAIEHRYMIFKYGDNDER